MKPECERFVPLILRSADGALAPDAAAGLSAHIASCVDCRAALAEQLAIRRLMKEIELPPAPPGFAARVRARVSRESGLFDLVNWRAWALRLMPAAALIALVAWYPSTTTSQSGVAATAQTLPAVVDEWAGGHAQVADGVLVSASSPDALLAAALGETSR